MFMRTTKTRAARALIVLVLLGIVASTIFFESLSRTFGSAAVIGLGTVLALTFHPKANNPLSRSVRKPDLKANDSVRQAWRVRLVIGTIIVIYVSIYAAARN